MERYLKAWWKALRPFSFTIAVISCLLGIVLAYADGHWNFTHALLVIIGGILLQSGVNLVNDFFEFKQGKLDNKVAHLNFFGQSRSKLEWLIYFSGLLCFGLTVPLGLYLVYQTGPPLLGLGILGFIGGYFYTGEPFNYKRRGLAFAFVFFLMGVLMIVGSAYAIVGTFNWEWVAISLPVSALVSLLLLSNELRDYEDDIRHGIRTLSTRIGYAKAARLYLYTTASAYFLTVLLYFGGLFPHLLFLPFSLVFLKKPLNYLYAPKEIRRPITPLTAKFHLIFGLLFIVTYLIDFH